jgi:hypothetical protein
MPARAPLYRRASAAGPEFRPPCWYGKTRGVDAYRWPFNNTKDPEYARYNGGTDDHCQATRPSAG